MVDRPDDVALTGGGPSRPVLTDRRSMRIVIGGGGTAGHVYPGLAAAATLRERGHEVTFVGTERGVESRLVPAAGFDLRILEAAPFVRRPSVAALRAPVVALRATGRCQEYVRGADVVVGMGGYVSVPAVMAARREGVPVVLHEQNAVPGLANRVLSRVAASVGVAFSDAAGRFPRRSRPRIVVTGNPVRPEIRSVPLDRDALAKEARQDLGLDDDRRTVVIFGGSQGALHIDQAAAGACRLLADREDLQVVLITGLAHLEDTRRGLMPSGSLVVRTFGYVDRMDLAYACADLVVSRAGATTIAEVTVCGLPALLIPYPHATGRHQEANARSLQRAGGASVLVDPQLSAATLAERIDALIGHEERLAAMAERSAAFGQPDAAERLADLTTQAAGS
ncbi:MAG: undecaprenyldiphospho-muramoylpentapeptide beta-N-acetylglucosaminyltransferase [Actinomycetota bacterium]